MNDAIAMGEIEEPTQSSGFYGAERAHVDEELPLEVRAEIDRYLEENPGGHERLIPLLHRVQERVGYLPLAVQEYVADKLGLSPIQVYGVISFYHFFTTTPRGDHEFKVCMGTACFVRHAQRLIETLEQVLDIDVGDVTEDRLFGLEKVRCLGACGLAPAMMHNDETLGNLTPKELRKQVIRLKSKARRAKETGTSES
jgi:NADP-reducing hydrogenase subunit HndA